MAAISALVVFCFFVALGITFEGWALSVLWNWFLPAIGVPVISIPVAIGISLIITTLTHEVKTDNRSKDEKITDGITSMIVTLLILGIGWIVKLFM